MATVSARVDDELKMRADEIAEDIGISLSSAISVFLKRFVAEQGFPFDVKAVPRTVCTMTDAEVTELAQKGVRRENPVPVLPASFYIDPQTKAPKTTKE